MDTTPVTTYRKLFLRKISADKFADGKHLSKIMFEPRLEKYF